MRRELVSWSTRAGFSRHRRPLSMPQAPGRVDVEVATRADRSDPATRGGAHGSPYRPYGLTGKVAIVTGGGSGIGAASAARLAEAGATVVVVDRDEESAHQVADRVGGLPVVADVSRSDQWGSITEAAVTRFGGVDLAHLNAGVSTGEADISLLTDEQYRRAVGVNVDGVVFGIRALVPLLRQRGGGSVVATASLAALIGYSPDPIYGLTKSAVVGLVRALAPQLAEQDITLNAICPSLVDTQHARRVDARCAQRVGVPTHRASHGGRGSRSVPDQWGHRPGHGHPGWAGTAGLPVCPTPWTSRRRSGRKTASGRAGCSRSGVARAGIHQVRRSQLGHFSD